MTRVLRCVEDLKGLSLASIPYMPEPSGVLMCPPDFYDVREVKNPLMAGNVGRVSARAARRQWDAVVAAFEDSGCPVSSIDAVPGLEDMVFCANQSLVGLNAKLEKVCLLSSMRHPSRRPEVERFESWFRKAGYKILRLKDEAVYLEGGGDAVWHPGRRLIWGGYGFRSEARAFQEVAEAFDAPVILLKLVNESFYHLDTCFCPVTPEAALIYPPAFAPESLAMILKIFRVVVAAPEPDAFKNLACNAAIFSGGTGKPRTAIIQKGTSVTARYLEALGAQVTEVETSEYIKSGGSVFCMKMFLY